MSIKEAVPVILLLIMTIIFSQVCKSKMKEVEAYEKMNKKHEKNIRLLRKQLETSNKLRDSAFHIIDNLNNDIEDLLRRDSLTQAENNRIKGMFDKMNSSQLRDEMIKKHGEAIHSR